MGKIVAAFGTSHAFTFMEPEKWDTYRAKNRESLKRRRNIEPPEQPGVSAETLAANSARFERVRGAHADIRHLLAETKPDALVLIGDDQHEVFSASTMPQIAIYVGGDFQLSDRFAHSPAVFRSHDALARSIRELGNAEGYDIAPLEKFENNELESHAHAQVLDAFNPTGAIPTVLVFLNAIQHPAIDPAGCYAFGKMVAQAITACVGAKQVAVAASGGWSHFTAGYPWDVYKGPNSHGAISEDFDRDIAKRMLEGKGETLAALSSGDLLANGNIELRAWIALMGVIGAARPTTLVYEPFYRAVMGMAAGTWAFDSV
jgi:hypothetical protein